MRGFNEKLINFIDASPTPFHAVANMARELEADGFIRLYEEDDWDLQDGKYFVTRNDSSIIIFNYPFYDGYTIIGAHTDSPNLKIKPNPLIESAGVKKLSVEPYGGVLLNPWFDRDLGIAGRVVVRENGALTQKIINIDTPVATIASLAIHLDKDANSSRSINKQTDILPITIIDDFESFILTHFGGDELVSHELSLYDLQKGSFIGDDFISVARLDNLLSCFCGFEAIRSTQNSMICTFMDHEEVGSDSTSGAGGSFLEEVLRKITKDDFNKTMRKSIMISCDNAHAKHPNFGDKHDANHAPLLNAGVVVKINNNQRYATNALTEAIFRDCAKKLDLPLQTFVTRSDLGCGSTIGPITATKLGVDTIDVGVAQLAMHSIREMCGAKDAYRLYQILKDIKNVNIS